MVHGNKGKKFSEEHKRKLSENRLRFFANGGVHPRLGRKNSEEMRKKMSNSLKGRKTWNKGKINIYSKEVLQKMSESAKKVKHFPPSLETRKKLSIANKGHVPWIKGKHTPEETKRKIGEKQKGELNHNWQGGITPKSMRIRNSLEMKLWKKACRERDNFTDQKTGIRGGKLEVHHINNFADFSELRTSISNGITLSKKSHEEFHKKYGKRNNTREQLEEFLKEESLEKFLKEGKENNYYEQEE